VLAWSNFFLGELGAAAALAGLLFVAVSVNQARILELGRMADRGLEALVMLFLVLVIASLPLIPGQLLRVFGAEVFLVAAAGGAALVPLQRGYLRALEPSYRPRSARMVWLNRLTTALMALGGLIVLCRGDGSGIYLVAAGILLTFVAVGANAWVLLIEINR
jgi:hypothetical protein